MLLALFRQIASDFDQLSSANWILNSFLVGLIATQPLVRLASSTTAWNRAHSVCVVRKAE